MESEIVYNASGDAICFSGPDAVACYAAAVLAASLRFYAKTGMMLSRGITSTALLQKAETITGKKYRRGDHAKAAADVSIWVQEMKAALPQVTR